MYKGKVFEVKRNATYPITIHHYYYDFPYLDGVVKHGPSMPILADRKGNAIIHIAANNEVWLSSGEIVDWTTDWPIAEIHTQKTYEQYQRESFWHFQGHILGSMAGE